MTRSGQTRMPVLAYCITEAAADIDAPQKGVGGANVDLLEEAGLRCFVSQNWRAESPELSGKEAALAFHQVLKAIFRQTTIIPFRFPTALASTAEISAHLREHAAEYQRALERLRGMVQMEVQLSLLPQQEGPRTVEASGTDYLRRRQAEKRTLQDAADTLRQAENSTVRRWRERVRSNGIRCYALMDRASVAHFQAWAQSRSIPPEIVARVSGPWPPTEFLEET